MNMLHLFCPNFVTFDVSDTVGFHGMSDKLIKVWIESNLY